MMLEIDVNGRTRTVSLERVAPEGGQFRVTIDDRVHVADACSVDASTLSLILLDAGGGSHEVGLIESGVPGELIAWTSEGPVHVVSMAGGLGASAPRARSSCPGERRVVAPMPGKVVRVLVTPGTEVTAGQGLAVVEAMKMENAVTSPKAGRVKEVAVEEGMSVEAGRLLVVVE